MCLRWKKKQGTLRVVTIAMLHLSFTLKVQIFGGLYTTQSKIYDGAFIAKIVSREVYSQKYTIVDACLGSKYASAF